MTHVANPTGAKRSRARTAPSVATLSRSLRALADEDAAYWSFVDKDDRDLVHSFFHYPAMMVPRLQRVLMEECAAWDSSITTFYDPFVGSGTVLTESMLLGKRFVGTDINPLAILVCRAKADFVDADALETDLRRVLAAAARDTRRSIAVEFPNRDKWFRTEVSEDLSRLRRAITQRRSPHCRRFWWVALAETVRLTSNSRTSTVKLHIRSATDLASRRPNALGTFADIAGRNVEALRQQQHLLAERRHLDGPRYRHDIDLAVADVRDGLGNERADILVTSPPYGDNHTTVPYGQASYLPLQWINRPDIGHGATDACVESTHRVDTMSLGGSRVNALKAADELLDRSIHLRRFFDTIKDNRDGRVRVGAFFRDLYQSLDPMLGGLRPGGLMIWTVGDRSVGGHKVPMASVLRELLGTRSTTIERFERVIPQTRKRMPSRNNTASTMSSETILVLQKACS